MQELRRRGRKPADAIERRARVEAALADLTTSHTPFSMADVAERAGISRATLYRDAGLRDLVGNVGDSPPTRPVTIHDYEKKIVEAAKLLAERKALRKQLRDAGEIKAGLEREIEKLEKKVAIYAAHIDSGAGQNTDTVRKDAYAEGFAQGVRTAMGQRGGGSGGARPGAIPVSNGAGSLASVAAKLPKPALLAARRNLARVLHPDLFAGEDAATVALATELLKQINALAAATGDKSNGA